MARRLPHARSAIALLLLQSFLLDTPLAADVVVWKPVEQAALRIDDRPPQFWNLYHAQKRDGLLLLELGSRYLLIDLRQRAIYELDPKKLERKDKNLRWHEADKPAKDLPTSDWTVRDAGRARLIRVRLAAEGRLLELQLPLPPDWRLVY